MMVYRPGGPFRDVLTQAGIPVEIIEAEGFLGRLRAVRSRIGELSPDVVLAFLPMPSLYAELAGALGRKWGLVVGERSSAPGWHQTGVRLRRKLHLLADAVVTNSHANRLILERSVPGLRGRVSTVYNAVDFEIFRAAPFPHREERYLRVVVTASYQRLKNVRGWVEAMQHVAMAHSDVQIETEWYGGAASAARGGDERRLAEEAVEKYGLSRWVHLLDAVPDVYNAYSGAHAVALPSLYEGLPNTVCEGMAVGRPVACSAVSDAGNLVEDGVTGVLFDPKDPAGIASKVAGLARRRDKELAEMGRAAHERAQALFDPARIATFYEEILEAAASRGPVPVRFWPEQIPATAYATADSP